MYTLKADGRLVAQSAADAAAFYDGTLLARVNCAEQLAATLLPQNPHQDYIALRKSVVTVERNGTEIFRGQAIDRLENGDGFVRFSCLGDLSYLRDGLIAPFNFAGSANVLIGRVLTEYNAQVAVARQISRGTIGRTGLGASISYNQTSYRSAWDVITGLVDQCGGFLRLRTSDGGDRVLDWLDDSGHFASQPIIWGDNLLSLNIKQDASGLINSIRATAGQDLSVLAEDAESIAQYGRTRVHMAFDAADAEELRALAERALRTSAFSVTGQAIDRWEKGFEPFRVGDFAQTVSLQHRLDAWIMVSELRHDLTEKSPTMVTLGPMAASITRSQRSDIINAWIVSRQGRSPALSLAIDQNLQLATDALGRLAVAREE